MLHFTKGIFPLILLNACMNRHNAIESPDYLTGQSGNGSGGVRPYMTLPFESGEYWNLTQGYNTGSHQDYGFRYGDDSYALDFSQGGCNPYGKPITPIMDGTVMSVEVVDTNTDHGYGNSVLIEHEDGYVSRYGHMTGHNVSLGEHVDTNTVLGWVGDTGYVVGNGCAEHPGTHLHLALYQDEVAVPPLPLSGTLMAVGCWYNREGDESCSGDPGPYDPVEGSSNGEYDEDDAAIEDDGDGLNVGFLGISPEDGTADHTQFVWVATVVSTHGRPNVTLMISNPNDGVTYDFPMETESTSSPWVFTYQKTLNDPSTYTYWVEAEAGGEEDGSGSQHISVNDSWNDDIDFRLEGVSPDQGEAEDTEFEWETWIEADDEPDVTLKIVNPVEPTIYSFDMEVEEDGHYYRATYEKTLRDSNTVYTWWIEAQSDGSTQNSSVQRVVTE